MRELAVVPGEFARFDQHSRDGRTMTANELGRRMHDDISAILEWPAEIWRGKGIVYHQGNSGFVGDCCDGLNVQYITTWIADGFPIEGACARGEGAPVIFGIGTVDKNGVDAPCAQGQVELGVCTTLEAA